MEEIGTVSLWLGVTDSPGSLENILQVSYSEDGDFEGSAFSRAFNIGFYDEDFREAEVLEGSYDSIDALLSGFSYEDIIIPRFSNLIGSLTKKFNTVVLLYNYKYDGSVIQLQDQSLNLLFFGSVSYKN